MFCIDRKGWIYIHKDSSLPFNEGDEFLIRRNECDNFCEYGDAVRCLKTRKCVDKLTAHIILVSMRDAIGGCPVVEYHINDNASFVARRSHIVNKFKEFKILSLSFYKLIHPERSTYLG